MRYFGVTNVDTAEVIRNAGANLLGGIYKYQKIDVNEDIVSDMVAVKLSKDCKIAGLNLTNKEEKIRYRIINEFWEFEQRAKTTYGIADPVESLFIWLAMMVEKSLDYVLSNPIEINFIGINYAEAYKRNKENRFLTPPTENIQKIMGGLPMVNSALALTNADLDKEIISKTFKLLSKRIKKQARRKTKHFVLLDNSSTVINYVDGSDIRKITYTAAVLLKIMEINLDKELFIYFYDKSSIVEEIQIVSNADRRRFWLKFGLNKFNSCSPFYLSFNSIYDFLLSDECRRCEAEGIQVELDIITNKRYKAYHEIRIDSLSEKLNSLGIKVNLFLLDSINEVIKEPDNSLIKLIHRLRNKSLFIPNEHELTDWTEKVNKLLW